MTAPLIVFDGVTKCYDGAAEIVRGLDLAIMPGEFLTLLGPSGSGKTTTLMMLAGFEDPTRGTISFDGRRIDTVPAYRRGIGVVFQNYALFPHMSVAGNLSFPLEMKGMGRAERDEAIRAALDMVQLGALAHRRPSELSGGQQQRVALARALVFRPKLVLMDEPLGALDKKLREAMQSEIRRIHERLGLTILYVTHDQGEALTLSDRIGVLNDGRLQQIATPQDIYETPANAFVASFIGENNGLEGTVERIDGGFCLLRTADGTVIRARTGAGVAVGARAVLALRPEKVRLGRGGDGDNRCEGQILERIYFGDHMRLRLQIAGSDAFLVRTGFSGGDSELIKGRAVTVSWPADHCLALAV